jgi:hypothetical protein
MMTASFLDGRARFLGYAGLLPQIFAVLLLSDEGLRWTALAGGFGYAALIFSFWAASGGALALATRMPLAGSMSRAYCPA